MPAATAAQNQGAERCLGCRISRMSSSEEVEVREDTGATGIKVVCAGEPRVAGDAALAGATVSPTDAEFVSAEAVAAASNNPSASAPPPVESFLLKVRLFISFSVYFSSDAGVRGSPWSRPGVWWPSTGGAGLRIGVPR